jgi:hypothetical protein
VADKTRWINRARAALREDDHNVPKTSDPWKWLEKHDTQLSSVTWSIIESCRRQREMFETEADALAIELKRFAYRNGIAIRLMSLLGVGLTVAAGVWDM